MYYDLDGITLNVNKGYTMGQKISSKLALLSLSIGLLFQTDIVQAKGLEEGKKAYQSSCQACHQATGQGLTGAFPPLAHKSGAA